VSGGKSNNTSLGVSPVHLASAGGHEQVASILIDDGRWGIDDKDIYGRTPLAIAAFGGYVELVRLLLAKVSK